MKPASEQRAWASPDSLDFFSRQRRAPDDLYASERIFLPDAARRAASVLDVGCACGGFAAIMRHFNNDIAYTGVDIVPEMLTRALAENRAENVDADFVAAAGHELPFADRKFDLVHCSGATHLNSRYRELIADMWRVSAKELLFDMRLTDGPSLEGTFRIDFDGTGEGMTLPYLVVNIDEARWLIDELPDAPSRMHLSGSRHPPSANADLPLDGPMIMAFLLLQRDTDESGWQVDIKEALPS